MVSFTIPNENREKERDPPSHSLHTNALFFREKHENVFLNVSTVVCEEVEHVSAGEPSIKVLGLRRSGGYLLHGSTTACVGLLERCKVHFNFFVRNLESLVNLVVSLRT